MDYLVLNDDANVIQPLVGGGACNKCPQQVGCPGFRGGGGGGPGGDWNYINSLPVAPGENK